MTTASMIGQSAPDFHLQDQDGNNVALASFKNNRPVVLIFYPGDDTPGCTKQLCTVRNDERLFQAAGVTVLGVNPGDADSHRRFIQKHQLVTSLLVDQDLAVARLYGATKKLFAAEIIQRTVVLIDRAGVIRGYWRGSPDTATILAVLQPTV